MNKKEIVITIIVTTIYIGISELIGYLEALILYFILAIIYIKSLN
ncbi:hypothetical protein [Hathewaya massiliensis]|nr:hypothetical protein [Hathewaya massiliensis]